MYNDPTTDNMLAINPILDICPLILIAICFPLLAGFTINLMYVKFNVQFLTKRVFSLEK